MSDAARSQTGGTAHQVGTEDPADDPGPSRDEIFDVLSNHRRRYALHYLKRSEENTELGTLSERVAAWENEVSTSEVSSDQRKRVYTSLQRYHLPKMDEVDLVDYDERSGEVRLTDRADELDLYMEVVQENDVPWSLYYVGLAVVGGVALCGHWAGLPPFDAVTGVGWVAFLITALLVSGMAHTYVTYGNRLGGDETPPEVER